MVSFRPLNKSTLEDAKSIVRAVFDDTACLLLEKMVCNSVLDEVPGADAGEILYIDNRPVGFDGAILKKLYVGQTCYLGVAGSTLCLLPEARKDMLCYDLLKRIMASRFGSVVFFGNTANGAGMKVTRAFGIKGKGSTACAIVRVAVVNNWRRIFNSVRRRLFGHVIIDKPSLQRVSGKVAKVDGFKAKLLDCFMPELFDSFWQEYLSGNRGFVCSRTSKELQWAFGKDVQNRHSLLVGLFKEASLRGYAVLKSSMDGTSYKVVDMLVIGNDLRIVHALLKGSLKLLRSRTRAVYLSISGFADFVQPVIKEMFPIERRFENNPFSWGFHDGAPISLSFEELNNEKSWFFGPYDGDSCWL